MAGALWLGVVTSISPCPLATNIAAISYIGRKVEVTGTVTEAIDYRIILVESFRVIEEE